VESKKMVSDKMRTLYKCPAFSDKLDNYKLLKNAATYIQ
jgi:hypothetical protein